jgi:iron complex outermembrane receptor protein
MVIAAVSTFPAFAQNAAQGAGAAAPQPASGAEGLDEIVVTAERREARAQNTAISITAIGAEGLRSQQITNLEGLSIRTPNVEFGRNAGDAKVFIRGVGYDSIAPGGETRVAIYNDGVYQSRTQAGFAGFYDVDRVEVLRGPQGTLYGRNATAGAINILTRDPGRTFNGYATVTVGNYGLVNTEAALGGRLSDSLSARLAFRTNDHSGYGKNIGTGEDVNDERSRSARLKLKFEPSAAFSFRLTGDYTWERDHAGGYIFLRPGRPDTVPLGVRLGGAVPTRPQDAAGYGPRFKLETYGLSGQAKLSLGSSTDLVSVTGFRHLLAQNESNTDGTTAQAARQSLSDKSDSFSQELRLQQDLGEFGDVLLGAYYFHEENTALNTIPFMGAAVGIRNPDGSLSRAFVQGFATRGTAKTNAYAAFAQARIRLVEAVTLTLGGRYSHEKKSIDEAGQFDVTRPYSVNNAFLPSGAQRASTSLSRFDPKVTIDYKPSENVFLYATYSRGYKSGGFNIGGVQPAFQPEVLDDYEVGLKLELLNRKLRVNLAAFHYDYSNLQVNIVDGVSLVTRNAATARIDGIEAEISALPVDGLRLGLNLGYLDSRYTSFQTTNPAFPELGVQDLAGNRLNYSPKWKLSGDAGYTFQTSIGEFTPRVSVTWVDRIYFSHFNLASVSQPARTEVNAFLGFESNDRQWSANLFVKNLTDKAYIVSSSVSTVIFGYPVLGQWGPPRTFGVSATRRF